MFYPYVPMPRRGRLHWPDGKRLAVILTINLEHWDMVKPSTRPYYAGGPSILPDLLPGNVADFPNFSWREYGQRVGLWRMIKEFDAAGVRASCTMNAKTALERRPMIDAALERGWELVAHNYEQGELLTDYAHDPDGLRRVVEASLEVYERSVGRKARGWLSCSLRGTPGLLDLLAEHGLSFFCDLMNDDQPYLISTANGPIVATPYSIEANDFTYFQRRGLSNEGAVAMLKEQFDVLYAESAETGLMMNVGLHPHVSGVPHRIRALREFIEHVKAHDDVWWATREEVADWYMRQHAAHIPVPEVAA